MICWEWGVIKYIVGKYYNEEKLNSLKNTQKSFEKVIYKIIIS